MLKNLLTKRNIYTALGVIGAAVVAGVVAKARKGVDNIVIEDVEDPSGVEEIDVAKEPIVKGKPVNRQPKQN